MPGIGRNWNGRIYGTNTGNVALTFDGDDTALEAVARFSDDRFGLVIYKLSGSFTDGILDLQGTPERTDDEAVQTGSVTLKGTLTPEGRLDGEWITSIQTGGTFQLWPHQTTPPSHGDRERPPEQLNTTSKFLGAIRLYSSDIEPMIKYLSRDFSSGRAVVTYVDHGNEINVFADEFVSTIPSLNKLQYLKISIQEPESHGINKLVIAELTSSSENTIRVQSTKEAWAVGTAEALANYFHKHERKLATQFRKFGLTANVIVQVFTLAAIPGLNSFGRRVIFASSMIALQAFVAFIHKRYIPNFLLDTSDERPSVFTKIWPGMLSWSITIVGAVVAAVVYGVLKGELKGSPIEKIALSVFG